MEWTNVGYVALSLFTVECIMHCSQPTVLVLGTPSPEEGVPLELGTGAEDQKCE